MHIIFLNHDKAVIFEYRRLSCFKLKFLILLVLPTDWAACSSSRGRRPINSALLSSFSLSIHSG